MRSPRHLQAKAGPRRPCMGCERRMVRGWTYCPACKERLRRGAVLDASDCLSFRDVQQIERWRVALTTVASTVVSSG